MQALLGIQNFARVWPILFLMIIYDFSWQTKDKAQSSCECSAPIGCADFEIGFAQQLGD